MADTRAVVKRRKPIAQLHQQPTCRVAECARCHEVVPIVGRGLCNSCWYMARKHGTLADYPRRMERMSADDLVEEYQLLASAGNTPAQIAARLGYYNAHYVQQRVRKILEARRG